MIKHYGSYTLYYNDEKNSSQLSKSLQEVCHENLIKEKSKEHAKELEVIRETFQQQLKQVAENHDKKLQSLLHDMEMKRKRDIHEIDGRKNKHIQEMLVKHGEDFTSIKNYYNDITHNSLDLLKALKDDVQMMRESEFHNEKLMLDLVEENRRMSSPLSLALKEVRRRFEPSLAHHGSTPALNAKTPNPNVFRTEPLYSSF